MYSYRHHMHIRVYKYPICCWRHHAYDVDMYSFFIHNTTHVILDMLANTPGASDLMPLKPRFREPVVVEHVPSDDSWKAASSDKRQSPNVAICVLTLSLSYHASSACMCTCIYVCVCVYIYIHIRVCSYIHLYVYVCTCMFVHILEYVCILLCYTWCTCKHVCIYVYMCLYVCVYIYSYN